jgi:hypothetical protein
MKFWTLSSGEPEEPAGQGFSDALRALEERRYAELGRLWRLAPERMQRAEARRRARREMARRIAQHTGKPPLSERTIARRGRRDEPPVGVDKPWLDRWAAIDRAGGIPNLARQLGTTDRRVRSWRDSPDPAARMPGRPAPPPGVPAAPPQRVGVETDGFVVINGKEYPKRIPENSHEEYAVLEVDPTGDLMQAWLDDNTELLYELLGDEIAMQIIAMTWSLPTTYVLSYRIVDLLKFLPNI